MHPWDTLVKNNARINEATTTTSATVARCDITAVIVKVKRFTLWHEHAYDACYVLTTLREMLRFSQQRDFRFPLKSPTEISEK